MRSGRVLWFLTALAVFLFVAAPAVWAGIIVTEGRVSDTGDEPQNGELGPCGELDDPDAEDNACGDDETGDDPVGDLSSDPVGWNCMHLAAGLEYCEPEDSGSGSGSGSGAGSGLRPSKAGAHVGEDGFACSGGPSAPLEAIPVALALAGLAIWTRRRQQA